MGEAQRHLSLDGGGELEVHRHSDGSALLRVANDSQANWLDVSLSAEELRQLRLAVAEESA